MNKLDQLKQEARESCEWRGHDMTRFKRGDYWRNCAGASCRVCGMAVWVDPNPMPNGIDISGEAVALNCGDLIGGQP